MLLGRDDLVEHRGGRHRCRRRRCRPAGRVRRAGPGRRCRPARRGRAGRRGASPSASSTARPRRRATAASGASSTAGGVGSGPGRTSAGAGIGARVPEPRALASGAATLGATGCRRGRASGRRLGAGAGPAGAGATAAGARPPEHDRGGISGRSTGELGEARGGRRQQQEEDPQRGAPARHARRRSTASLLTCPSAPCCPTCAHPPYPNSARILCRPGTHSGPGRPVSGRQLFPQFAKFPSRSVAPAQTRSQAFGLNPEVDGQPPTHPRLFPQSAPHSPQPWG